MKNLESENQHFRHSI